MPRTPPEPAYGTFGSWNLEGKRAWYMRFSVILAFGSLHNTRFPRTSYSKTPYFPLFWKKVTPQSKEDTLKFPTIENIKSNIMKNIPLLFK